MKEKMVQTIVDHENLPPLTENQKANIAALMAMPDKDIDCTDIPELTDEFWQTAKPILVSDMFRPRKNSTTVRMDADILAWLRSKGKGYQTRMNEILRQAMLNELKK